MENILYLHMYKIYMHISKHMEKQWSVAHVIPFAPIYQFAY
jgi:hypothetical protein